MADYNLATVTGDELRAEVVRIARSFLGAKEGGEEHLLILSVYNGQDPLPRGYKMTAKDAWCAAFCTAVGLMAGVGSGIPRECSCSRLIAQAKEGGIWVESDGYKPKLGDWCVYDWDDDGKGDCTGAPDHIGIVTKVGASGFTVTEGNYSNRVKDRTMQVDGKYIRGYICPDYDAMAEAMRLSVAVAGFLDVSEGVYYEEPLVWAKEKGIVYGVDDAHFGPELTTSRAQAVAMLHRLWCAAQPTGVELPFEDVPADAWYRTALEWAYDRGIVIGVSDTAFEPDKPVKRCEIVAMIHRLMASPAAQPGPLFVDVQDDAWYYGAVSWAAGEGIAQGVGGHRFEPEGDLLRRDAVCLIYRWYSKV